MVRRTTITLLAALLLLCGSLAAGLRINGTHSVPPGIYWATGKHPEKGDFVFVRPPPAPIFAVAKERGYLDVGYSPAPHLIKRLAAVAGDRVTINSAGVEVNGVRLMNSKPMTNDGDGRPLHYFPLQNYILGTNEVLLMSEYNPASFDARYFGPLHATTIESVVLPLLTWN